MSTLREAAKKALRYMEDVGQAEMWPGQWAVAEELRAALAEEQPTAVEKEREACARLCDAIAITLINGPHATAEELAAVQSCADAIRARGKT